MTMDESAFAQRVNAAMVYVKKIVVESDGYPMDVTANTLRTLLVNAFLAGLEAHPVADCAVDPVAQTPHSPSTRGSASS